MTILKSLAVAAIVYVVTWALAYVLIMRGDMDYLREYFVLSWTSPGEIPALIQFVAVLIGLIAGSFAFYIFHRSSS